MSDASQLSALGKAALGYLGLGYRVFPLIPGKKKPLTSNGFKDATDDRVRVIEWWTSTPGANIGIATGAGLIVIDVDRLDGEQGRKTVDNPFLTPINDRLAELEPGAVSVSPSGGGHLWYRTSNTHRSNASEIGEGVDHRCEGGYIVAAPSVLDGSDPKDVPGEYRWLEGRGLKALEDLEPLPSSIESAIGRKRAKKEAKAPATSIGKILEGKRHHALVSEAGRLRNLGIGPDAILAELRNFNAVNCNPPQDDDDLERIARDIGDKPLDEPFSMRMIRASEVEDKDIEWLIEGRIPRGMLTIFAGLPGAGKSAFAAFIASKVSTGRGMKDCAESWPDRDPADVIYLALEDPFDSIVKPRLLQMGAHLDRIHLCEIVGNGTIERGVTFDDLEMIRAEVRRTGAALVIIDTFDAAWPGDKSPNSGPEVREVLQPWKRMAEEERIGVIVIHHTNKRSDVGDAQDIVSGSRGVLAAARCCYLFASWTDPDGGREHFMLDLKVNIREPRPAIVYEIKAGVGKGQRIAVSVLEMRDLDANAFLREKARRDRAERARDKESKVKEAERAVLEALAERRALLSTELEKVVIEKGISKASLDDALKGLRQAETVITEKEKRQHGRSWTFLPGAEPAELRQHREHRQDREAQGKGEV